VTTTVLYMTIDSMEGAARRILESRGVDPDGLADQGDAAADIGVRRRTISVYRQMYRGPGGRRGVGRAGPHRSTGAAAVEPFPEPSKVIGGGGGNPVWMPRWRILAWHLTREQALTELSPSERALVDQEET
jgi:hypothetical protein